jgi:hypothetical protein
VTTTTAPITFTSNGWIDYYDSQLSTISLLDESSTTVQGTLDSQGNCSVTPPAYTPHIPSDYSLQEETAYNPSLCEATYVSGEVNYQTAQGLNVIPSTPGVSNPQLLSRSFAERAFIKSAYVDPVHITITSFTLNLQINPNSTPLGIGSDVPYEFAFDGWSGTPATYQVLANGTNTAVSEFGVWQRSNTAFESLLEDAGSLVNYVYSSLAWFACGLTNSPAVFTQNEEITLNSVGQYTVNANADSKTGGCSDLVHFKQWSGWGTDS